MTVRARRLVCFTLILTGCQNAALTLEQNTAPVISEAPTITPPEALTPEPVPEAKPLIQDELMIAVVMPKPVFANAVLPPAPQLTLNIATEPPRTRQLGLIRTVNVNLDLIGVNPGTVTLEFVAPSGQVFQSDRAELVGTAFENQQLSFSLPVAGTLIDSSSLVGRWTTRVFVSGVQMGDAQFEVAQ
jgi:hypothetical protein